MKPEKVTPLERMSREELEDIARSMESRAEGDPIQLGPLGRQELIDYIESLKRPSAARRKPERRRKPRMPKNEGVGRYCKELLAKVIADGPDGPIGLSYKQMVRMAQRKFPDSAVDERHLRWYAAQMRRDDKIIPVNRERSSWI